MAEKVIRTNESLIPFLGERLNFIRGLDPLGLQNTSDTTFSLLLPGLNNVTGRIRYYSFYCWVLDIYSKVNGSTNPEEQKKFIRRAEFIVALASNYIDGDRSSIPGTNYAILEIDINKKTEHDLQSATFKPDGSTRGSYWTYPTGAFGQYYFGSLRNIGIITERENQSGIYVRINKRTDDIVRGEDLAEAFDQNISAERKQLFLNAIYTGRINEVELKSLLPDFNLTQVPNNSKEQDLLIKLLIQKDYPLRIEDEPYDLRKQTVKHLLQFIIANRGELTDRSFVYNCYKTKGKLNSTTDNCLMGWYYYQFNEFWHYANTSILNGTLAYLENTVGPKWMPIYQLVTEVTQGVIQFYIDHGYLTSGDEDVSSLLTNISVLNEFDCFNNCSKTKIIEKVANAFLLMFTISLNNKSQLVELKEYSENNELGKDGEPAGYFVTQFGSKKQTSIYKFLFDYIYVNVIYRHQYVAFRKIGGGIQSTQKFIIEDLNISFLGNFEATYTGPRVGNLIAFLKDVHMVTPENSLTDHGVLLLNNLNAL